MKSNMTTPIGSVKFQQLSQPDAKGKYSVALVLDPKLPEVKKFLKELDAAVAESKFPKSKVYKFDKERNENGEFVENENILMNFISKYEVKMFDAAKNEISDVNVGWGTKARIAFTPREFEVDGNKGIAKYIRGIQIIDLKGGATAESCGFGEEEGYVSQPSGDKDLPWED